MHFKHLQTVRGLRLDDRGLDPAGFDVEIRGRLHRVQLRRASDEEQRDGFPLGDTQCDSSTEFEPSLSARAAFEALARNQLPKNSAPYALWGGRYDFIDSEGRIESDHFVPLTILPESLQEFVRQLNADLNEAAQKVVSVTRWRLGEGGPHQPFAHRGGHWSFDGHEWHPLPIAVYTGVSDRVIPRIDQQRKDEIQDLLNERIEAPLAHTLFREAWEQRNENRRSALLTGMTALEIGVKQYLAARVPEATWLLEELQNPPLTRLLSEYLQRLDGYTFDPGKLDILKRGVNLRNRVAHRDAPEPKHDELDKILTTVRETLWWLDELRGFGWAKNYTSIPAPD
jgi:hypothetical protein